MPPLVELQYKLPDHLLRFVAADLAPEAKLMAARGMLPLPPRDLVLVLFAITRMPDKELKKTATASLTKIPENILKTICDDPATHPQILDFMARGLPTDSPLQEAISLNRGTHDDTIVFQATLTNKRLVEIIAENQLRILRCPDIVDALAENVLMGQAQLDRILKFVALETRRAMKGVPLPPPPPKPAAAEGGEEGEEEEEEFEVPAVTAEDEELSAVTLGEGVETAWAAMTFHDDLLKEYGETSEEEMEDLENNLYKKIQGMKISQKIKLALMGGSGARAILIKDSNKMVSTAVMKSPRITEKEIEMISKSRSVCDDVIRMVAGSREWTRGYQIKMNLVANPKCPQGDAMRFLNFLRDKDLRDLSKSKNVPNSVAGQAKRVLQRKELKNKPGAKKG